MRLMNWVNRLLTFEEINGHGVCSTYLYRWTLLSTPLFKIYLHHFVGDDWAIDPHDHPKNFLSIGLRGEYLEEVYRKDEKGDTYLHERKRWYAPWLRRFPANHIHRIEAHDTGGAWTICIVGRRVRNWGFVYIDYLNEINEWIDWKRYVKYHGSNRKSC